MEQDFKQLHKKVTNEALYLVLQDVNKKMEKLIELKQEMIRLLKAMRKIQLNGV